MVKKLLFKLPKISTKHNICMHTYFGDYNQRWSVNAATNGYTINHSSGGDSMLPILAKFD